MDFFFHGQRVHESTEMTSRTRAKEVEAKRKQELRERTAGIRKPKAPRLLTFAAKEWVNTKKWKSERTRDIATNRLKHLDPIFGKRLLLDIEPRHIHDYQQ